MTPIHDDYKMPFGKHKGEAIGFVSASYLDWLSGQDWLKEWPQVARYIEENREHIDRELEDRDE